MFLEVLEGSGNPGRRPRVPASNYLITTYRLTIPVLVQIR